MGALLQLGGELGLLLPSPGAYVVKELPGAEAERGGLVGNARGRNPVGQPPGLADQAAALRFGAREFLDDVRAGAKEKEAELADTLGVRPRVVLRALERDAS